jgi:hypothetical protein
MNSCWIRRGPTIQICKAAHTEAIEGARQLISEAVLTGGPLRMQRAFQIDDADGHTLLTVPFTDAINSGDKL